MPNVRTRTILWIAASTGLAIAGPNCGIEALPPHFAVPAPRGEPGGFHCEAPRATAPAEVSAPAPFDDAMAAWPDRTGVFRDAHPIAQAAIRAQDAVVERSPQQVALLSAGASQRAASLVPIGGDYWVDTPYPIGPRASSPWVSSAFGADATGALPHRAGDDATGEMSSAPFVLAADYLRLYVGGDPDDRVGVELVVRVPADRDVSRCAPPGRAPSGGALRAAAGFVAARVRPVRKDKLGASPTPGAAPAPSAQPDREELVPFEVALNETGCDLRGLTATLRVFDEARSAHVNVGRFALSSQPLTGAEKDATPLWGFADFHTHPTNYLSLGGLQGIPTLWGAPGGAMSEYVGDPAVVSRHFARDIPPCDDAKLPFNGHHGGPAAPIMINSAEGRLSPSIDDLGLGDLTFKHASNGGPTFADFPDFRAGAHEQYHITQIHRAYLGGLRLLSALAIHNRGLEYGMGWVRCGDNGNPTVDTTSDWTVIRAHVRAMKQLAYLNRDWMEIAYSPADARRIIRANKLAVVLGVEVPQLGLDADGDPATQVGNLEALGVRQVILVHGMDNLLGGTAVFEDLYNSVNDWMYRPAQFRDKVETLSGVTVWTQYPASFYEITSAASPPVTTLPIDEKLAPTEPILFRLANPERVVLSDLFPRPPSYAFFGFRFGDMHTLVSTTPLFTKSRNLYDETPGKGHRNARGLTGRGGEFIQRLIERGMLVDLAHMSDATLSNSYDVASNACGDYPLIVSHAHFRPLAMTGDESDLATTFVGETGARVRADLDAGVAPMTACIHDHTKCDDMILGTASSFADSVAKPSTTSRENVAREFDIPSSEIQQVRARDGVVGAFVGQGALNPSSFGPGNLPAGLAALPIPLDCAGSSQGLGAALLFLDARMKGKGGMGVASDFTFTTSASPRFGDNACAGYLVGGGTSNLGAQLLETLIDPDQYRFTQQKDAVNYSSSVTTCVNGTAKRANVPCGPNVPLDPYTMGSRTYDVNLDGFAHYGLLPDMLQDVANEIHEGRRPAFDPLFQSANAYIDAWAKAQRLSHCEAKGLCTEPDRAPDPECLGTEGPTVRRECGLLCPCGWNHGAPLHEIQEVRAACDPGKPITLPIMDPRDPNATELKYQQRRTHPENAGDMGWQGDWAVYRIQKGQTWKCGESGPRDIGCPAPANYVKVRRVLDTTVSRFTDRCDYQPLPPEDGNRSVLFQCLVGPTDDAPRSAP
jgi:hypothetical protein